MVGVVHLADLHLADFTACVGTTFRMEVGQGRWVDATLDEAQRGFADTERNEQFSLTFRVRLDVALPARIYRMSSDAVGNLDLFLTPVGRDAECILYEAWFNRLTAEEGTR